MRQDEPKAMLLIQMISHLVEKYPAYGHPLFLILLYLMLSLNFSNENSSIKIYTKLLNVFILYTFYNV